MEDTYIANVNIQDGISLFAIFDGHGGDWVSNFVKC